ncbi:trimethyllysine dioxygenase, mitochondrial-like [Haematobia irritans]|uniref:trimethyllysine dioxygenase, mitochondrial-like n=1 Tax=Haematobia irritans TaxID=7368 RepID=UPI003F500E7B
MDYNMVDIKYNPNGAITQVDPFWLRDHCKCSKCFNSKINRRIFNILDIPKDLKTKKLKYLENETKVEILWSDNHFSKYDIDFIISSQLGNFQNPSSNKISRTLWNFSLIKKNRSNLYFNLGELCTSEVVAKNFVTSLIRYGLAFITAVPPNITATEMAIRRLFPLMKTFHGEMFLFPDNFLRNESTNSQAYVEPHTDGTYFSDPMGLQAIHCIEEHGEVGDIFFSDGFYIAQKLCHENPKAFEMLSTIPVPSHFKNKDECHKFSAPIVSVNPLTKDIDQLRFNSYDRSVFNSFPQNKMKEFYRSMEEFLSKANDNENRWQITLNPGTMVIFDNWRLLHGRCSYIGHRVLARGYVARTDFLSKARVMGIIENEKSII